jgi:hypothetical protein
MPPTTVLTPFSNASVSMSPRWRVQRASGSGMGGKPAYLLRKYNSTLAQYLRLFDICYDYKYFIKQVYLRKQLTFAQ